jgi:hypothetical protein
MVNPMVEVPVALGTSLSLETLVIWFLDCLPQALRRSTLIPLLRHADSPDRLIAIAMGWTTKKSGSCHPTNIVEALMEFLDE